MRKASGVRHKASGKLGSQHPATRPAPSTKYPVPSTRHPALNSTDLIFFPK